jgi:hypothetical protein
MENIFLVIITYQCGKITIKKNSYETITFRLVKRSIQHPNSQILFAGDLHIYNKIF